MKVSRTVWSRGKDRVDSGSNPAENKVLPIAIITKNERDPVSGGRCDYGRNQVRASGDWSIGMTAALRKGGGVIGV